MPQTVDDAIFNNEREDRFLKQLKKSYPDACFDAEMDVWRSRTLRPEDCDYALNRGEILLMGKSLEDGVVFCGGMGTNVPVSVFLMRLSRNHEALRVVLDVLRNP